MTKFSYLRFGNLPFSFDALPLDLTNYVEHVVRRRSIRAISRDLGCSASTVLRRIRKIENRRDDRLYDEAVEALTEICALARVPAQLEFDFMPKPAVQNLETDEDIIASEARRILRRLCEKEAFLAMHPGYQNAAVFKELVPGKTTRIAVVAVAVARAFVLREWIEPKNQGKLSTYQITSVGRIALKRLIAEEKATRTESSNPFAEQHQEFGKRSVKLPGEDKPTTVRYNLAESPLSLLAKKKDKWGQEYLSPDLLEAGERLREDFERAHLGTRVAQNWERFLSGVSTPIGTAETGGSDAARQRVLKALEVLGPGLGDVVLRVCCYLEGLERAEKRLGWSARSGKVVLKIALTRLAYFYGISQEGYERKAC